jgi:hypothetical protein
VAVRDYDYDDVAPRYVAVRRSPVYAAEQNYVPRQRVVAVRHPEINDVSYVAVQRVPEVDDYYEPRATKVVAVRNTGCGCSRAVSYRTAVDDDVDVPFAQRVVYNDDIPYTSSVRHVVVKTDNIDGTEEVLYSSGSNYDDSAYVDLPDASIPVTGSVAYNDMDDVDFNGDDAMYDNVAYVTNDDMDAACLPDSAVYALPRVATRSVSFTPADEVNDYDVIGGTDVAFVADDEAAPPLQYEVTDADYEDTQTAFVEDGDIDADCPDDVSTMRYDDYTGARAISYVPIEQENNVPVENVVYVPADDNDSDCSCETSMNTFDNGSVNDVDAVTANYVSYSDPDSFDDPVAAVDVGPYVDDHAAEARLDVDFTYVE